MHLPSTCMRPLARMPLPTHACPITCMCPSFPSQIIPSSSPLSSPLHVLTLLPPTCPHTIVHMRLFPLPVYAPSTYAPPQSMRAYSCAPLPRARSLGRDSMPVHAYLCIPPPPTRARPPYLRMSTCTRLPFPPSTCTCLRASICAHLRPMYAPSGSVQAPLRSVTCAPPSWIRMRLPSTRTHLLSTHTCPPSNLGWFLFVPLLSCGNPLHLFLCHVNLQY
jgi:hypothetical protein